jgi:hypothetical protein
MFGQNPAAAGKDERGDPGVALEGHDHAAGLEFLEPGIIHGPGALGKDEQADAPGHEIGGFLDRGHGLAPVAAVDGHVPHPAHGRAEQRNGKQAVLGQEPEIMRGQGGEQDRNIHVALVVGHEYVGFAGRQGGQIGVHPHPGQP